MRCSRLPNLGLAETRIKEIAKSVFKMRAIKFLIQEGRMWNVSKNFEYMDPGSNPKPHFLFLYIYQS